MAALKEMDALVDRAARGVLSEAEAVELRRSWEHYKRALWAQVQCTKAVEAELSAAMGGQSG